MVGNVIQIKSGIAINFNERNATYKTKNFYISLAFLLITIALLIAVSFNFSLIKNNTKQKILLPYYFRNNKLKKNCINDILSKWRVMMNWKWY